MISVTRIFKFEAAHYLPKHEGKCKNVHGHSYQLEVEITFGPNGMLNDQKMIMDFGDLKNLVNPLIEEYLDHHLLNETLCKTPTAEVMVDMIAYELNKRIQAPFRLLRIRLWETENCYAEWTV
jgi:6-pyruvoyltetrahydropterin/6-carboxytetrahydropterin synthase